MDIRVEDGWRRAYPGASAGFLAMEDVANPAEHAGLAGRVGEIEAELRGRWAGLSRADLLALPELAAYRDYYRRFDKTYHVQLQLESVVLKGKPLRGGGALVLAMFAAELRNRLLTAGHDLAAVEGPVRLDVARGGERYVGIGGRELALQPGDMYLRDDAGVLSSVLYGPDDRTRMTPETRRALFCVYAVPGVGADAVARHLDDVAALVRLVAPRASASQQVVAAGSGSGSA